MARDRRRASVEAVEGGGGGGGRGGRGGERALVEKTHSKVHFIGGRGIYRLVVFISSIIVLLPRRAVARQSHPQPSSLVQEHIFDPLPEPIVTASRVRVRRGDGNLVQNDDDLVVPSTRQRPR